MVQDRELLVSVENKLYFREILENISLQLVIVSRHTCVSMLVLEAEDRILNRL